MQDNMEIWKDIKGYEGLYQISNLGNVKSVQRFSTHWQGGVRIVKERILKHSYKKGYAFVDLSKNNIRSNKQIHRLIAEHFIPNPKNYPIVLHKDDDPSNMSIDNLMWGTTSINAIHAYENGRMMGFKQKLLK